MTVILRPGFGRRISRNDWNDHAVSRHFGEDLRESARMQQIKSDSFREILRPKPKPQDDRFKLSTAFFSGVFSR